MPLPRAIDFGDSYAQIVRRDVIAGGFPLIAFYQMDKATGGLKRIQLERQRHGVNPPAFRAVLTALEAAYGSPDAMCGVRPGPASGYQAAAGPLRYRGRWRLPRGDGRPRKPDHGWLRAETGGAAEAVSRSPVTREMFPESDF